MNTLQEIVKQYSKGHIKKEGDVASEIRRTEALLEKMRKESGAMFQCECEARSRLNEEIKKAEVRLNFLKSPTSWPAIDLVFLKQRVRIKTGKWIFGSTKILPRFAAFPIVDNRFIVRTNGWDTKTSEDRIHVNINGHSKILRPYFYDLYDLWHDQSGVRGRSSEFQCEFKGVIPSETRAKITSAIEVFTKDAIFLVQEIDYTKSTFTEVIDPLVIGVKDGQGFLIDLFDASAIEHYIASEFTQ